MTDYHVITHEVDELVMQVIDGQLIIVPPTSAPQPPSDAPETDVSSQAA